MDVDLFAGVAVSDLPARCQLVRPILRSRPSRSSHRARPDGIRTPPSIRRATTRARRVRHGTLFIDDFDGFVTRWRSAASSRTRRRRTGTAYARPHVATRTATRSVSAAPQSTPPSHRPD